MRTHQGEDAGVEPGEGEHDGVFDPITHTLRPLVVFSGYVG